MNPSKISSISDFIALIADYRSKDDLIWFRGHSDVNYRLLPGYYRQEHQTSEASILKRFKQNASLLVENGQRDEFDWMFLMQHYGVPTRLLDWSDSALVALYFCCSSKQDIDGAIWLLKPVTLNVDANIKDDEDSGYLPSFQDELLDSYKMDQLKRFSAQKLRPIATIANRNNARLQAQLGNFTIHHNDKESLEDLSPGACLKITVEASNKKKLLKELDLLGVAKLQLFPELSSVGEFVKGRIQ